MRVLVVNAGSSSLKSQLLETDGKISLMKCLAEKVGTDQAYMNVSFAPEFKKTKYQMPGLSVAECLAKLLDILVEDPESPISALDQIEAVGNRIVAGGEYFTKSAIIDDEAREKLALCEELAPLHNPPADQCIDMMREINALSECRLPFSTRHSIPPCAEGVSLCNPARVLREVSYSSLWRARHEPSLCRSAGCEPARPPAARPGHHYLPSGQRRFHHGREPRQVYRHHHGLHAA